MVLYYATTYYQLLCCILHRLKNPKQTKYILVVDQFIEKNCPNMKYLLSERYFNEYYSLKFIPIKSKNENELLGFFAKEYKEKVPYSLNDFEAIYLAGAHSWFGVYVSMLGLHFSMFEECCAILSKVEKLQDNVQKTSVFQAELDTKYGLFEGDSPQIDKVLCNFDKQNDIGLSDKCVEFDVMKELDSLTNEEREKILRVFTSMKKIQIEKDATLLITQHFFNLNIMSWDDQVRLYTMLVDYFGRGKLLIKTHPADIMDYENIFPDAIVIRETIPIELLLYIFSDIPKTAISVSSTATNTIEDKFENVIKFDFAFEKDFEHLHAYYMGLKLIQNSYPDISEYKCIGVNQRIVENVLKFTDLRFVPALYEANDIADCLIVDDYDSSQFLEKKENYKLILYLNSKEEHLYECLKHGFKPIDIFQNNGKLCHTFYVLNLGGKKVSNVKKELECEETELLTKSYTGQELRIKELEGMLNATENRLKFYIDKVEELEKQLEERK